MRGVSGTVRRVYGAVRSRARLWALKGDATECPCCGSRFVTFLPYGHPPRPNASCPTCNSKERHRLLWLYLDRETNLFRAPLRVLHIAPEDVFFERLSSSPDIDYVPGDHFLPGYAYPPGTLDLDVTALALPDASVDVILCSHVLEHVPDDHKAMGELFRVLRPGGWAVLQVPQDRDRPETDEDLSVTDPEERLRRYGQRDHVRLYGRDYADRLRAAGFEVEEVPYCDRFTPEQRFRYGLPGNHVVHHCRRPR